MATTLVQRARELLGMGRQPGPHLARQLAREFPAYEQHEVWGAVGLGPTQEQPSLFKQHLNPHEVRSRVDPRPDKPPEHPTEAATVAALKAAGARKPKVKRLTPRQERILAVFRAAGEVELAEQEGHEAFIRRSR